MTRAVDEQTVAARDGVRDTEHVVVVDLRGRPAGTLAKASVHGRTTPLHLGFSAYLVRGDGSVLLARRADEKRTWPGVWSNSCCGHPQLGESLFEAAARRLAQELGVTAHDLAVVLPDFAYRAEMADGTVEHELCPVVVARIDGDPTPEPEEVSAVEWVTWAALLERVRRAPETLSPWCVEQVLQLDAAGWSPTEAIASTDGGAPLAARSDRLDGEPDVASSIATVEQTLSSFLAEKQRAYAADSAERALFDEVHQLVAAGGKRLRPAFAYWGYRAAGHAHDDSVLPPAAALELLHTFALLHDDVMDRSATRRGRPSTFAATATAHERLGALGDSEWFGLSVAILAGDLAFVLADELFERSPTRADTLARARRVFDTLRTEVIGGQHLDLLVASNPASTERDARRVAVLKSARYTVTRPLLLGAALAEPAEAGRIEPALTAYGDAIGLAFQMRDDVLGVFGDPAATGKSCLDDLQEGKRTVLVLRALRLADASGRRVLERSLGNRTLDDDGARRCRQVIESSGALASVEALIAAEHDRAMASIETLPPIARAALEHLALAAVERDA